MILKHPIPEEKISLVVETYGNRFVCVRHGKRNLWMDNYKNFNKKLFRSLFTLEKAIKYTENFTTDCEIEFHFISEIGDDITPISEKKNSL